MTTEFPKIKTNTNNISKKLTFPNKFWRNKKYCERRSVVTVITAFCEVTVIDWPRENYDKSIINN